MYCTGDSFVASCQASGCVSPFALIAVSVTRSVGWWRATSSMVSTSQVSVMPKA